MRKVMMAAALAVASAGGVGGCATMSYLSQEYGSAREDGAVVLDSGLRYLVWHHKSGRRIIISADVSQAMGMGLATGLTFGAADESIPKPVFDEVARRWFAQTCRPECRTVSGHPIHRVYYEYEFTCAPEPPPPRTARR